MKIPPSYSITPEMLSLISKIDSLRLFFLSYPIPENIKKNIQRISLLRSSLFSARIEGNPLTMENLNFSTDEEKKIEVVNIQEAGKYMEKNLKHGNPVSKDLILHLHSLTMKGLRSDAGFFRKNQSAIFNQSGEIVYMPPPPGYMYELLEKLLDYLKSDQEKFPILKALIAHLIFEKIHPFIDGNGRVGRLLIFAICKTSDFDFDIFVPFEEFLDKNRNDYYRYLDLGLKETNDYLIFMLKAFLNESEKLKDLILKEQNKKIILPPREEEIFNIINDHPMISFDFIRRRFLKVPERTLRYDLKKLADKSLIIKIGKTRGSYYKSIDD